MDLENGSSRKMVNGKVMGQGYSTYIIIEIIFKVKIWIVEKSAMI